MEGSSSASLTLSIWGMEGRQKFAHDRGRLFHNSLEARVIYASANRAARPLLLKTCSLAGGNGNCGLYNFPSGASNEWSTGPFDPTPLKRARCFLTDRKYVKAGTLVHAKSRRMIPGIRMQPDPLGTRFPLLA